MTAKGFCTCKLDFPQRTDLCPPVGATWHYLCDKPTNPADWPAMKPEPWPPGDVIEDVITHRETGTGWPVTP